MPLTEDQRLALLHHHRQPDRMARGMQLRQQRRHVDLVGHRPEPGHGSARRDVDRFLEMLHQGEAGLRMGRVRLFAARASLAPEVGLQRLGLRVLDQSGTS